MSRYIKNGLPFLSAPLRVLFDPYSQEKRAQRWFSIGPTSQTSGQRSHNAGPICYSAFSSVRVLCLGLLSPRIILFVLWTIEFAHASNSKWGACEMAYLNNNAGYLRNTGVLERSVITLNNQTFFPLCFLSTLYARSYLIGIFTYSKLCLADASHNFK